MFNFQKLLPAMCFLFVAAMLSGGCNTKTNEDKPTSKPSEAGDPRFKGTWLYATKDDSHHIRLKIDKTSKEIHAYLLGSDAKTPTPVDAKALKMYIGKGKKSVEFILEPKPEKSDGEGKSSVFVAKADNLPKEIDKKAIEFTTEFGGKGYSFELDTDDAHAKD